MLERDHCKLGKKYAHEHTVEAVGEPKKPKNSVAVACTLDHTQQEDKLTLLKFMAKGALLHGMFSYRRKI